MKIGTKIFTVSLPVVLAAACLVLAAAYLNTGMFQRHARAFAVSRIEAATGLRCAIERMRVRAFRGRLEIDGLALASPGGAPGPVSVRVDEIRAAVRVSSFWHFRMRLAELDIVRPRVELVSGGGAAAWDPAEALRALRVSLRLEASRVRVREGLLRVNGRTAPFNLSLRRFDGEIRYAKEGPAYKIRVAYESGGVFWERRDIPHDLTASLDLSARGVEIEFFKFRYRSSLLTGGGSIRGWDAPVLLVHAAGLCDASDLTLAHPSIRDGHGTISVTADIRNDRAGLSARGAISIRSGGYRAMRLHDLTGRFEVKDDVLLLRAVSGGIARGGFDLDADIQLREANPAQNRVRVATRGVPVVEAGRLLDLPLLILENPADASVSVTWHHGDEDLKVDGSARLHGEASSQARPGDRTPLDGTVDFTYRGTGDVLVRAANLVSAHSSLRAADNGDGSFRVGLTTRRIAEPMRLIANFSGPVLDILAKKPDLFSLAGTFGFDGDARIRSESDVALRGVVAVRDGRWRNLSIARATARADFQPPFLRLRELQAQSGARSLAGEIDLELAGSEHIAGVAFRGNARGIPLASLEDFGLDPAGAEGTASGDGSLQYAQGEWSAAGDVAIENGSYRGELFDRVRARVRLEHRVLRLTGAEARRAGARASAEGTVDLGARQMDLKVGIRSVPIDSVPAVRDRRLPVRGLLSSEGALTGSFHDPSYSGSVALSALRYGSWDLGSGGGAVEFRSGTAKGTIRIQSPYGALSARGQMSAGAGNPGSVGLEFENLDLRKIAGAKIPPYLKDVSTALRGKVDIEGRFDDPASLRMRGEVDGATFKVQDYELHNAGRLQFSVLNKILRIESVRFVGDGTDLVLSGRVPLEDAPRLEVHLSGGLNLALLNGLNRKLHVAGASELNIRASGSYRDPQVIGQASFRDSRVDYDGFPFPVSGMQGDMIFSRDLVRFENVRASAASGSLQLSGIVEHRNAVVGSMNLNLAVRNARLPYPKDFRSVVNADLTLSGSGDVQALSGDVDVLRAEYVRDFNLLEQLAGGGAIHSGPLTADPALRGLRLNVEIRSNRGLVIDNELAKITGSMRLMLRGTPEYPMLTGRVEASEGTILFRGSRFEISRAAADFIDRNRMNPVLEVRAEADVKTYRLILDAVGELDRLNLNITSDPPMSTVEILSMLTTGKRESVGSTTQYQSEIAGMSAASVLSENLTGALGKRVQRIFGLESFRVDPFLAGAENDPTARITVSERISKDLVVTFSRNLTTNQEQIVVIEYDVTKDLSLLATRDEDGKFGLDFRFRKRWR